MKQEENYKIRNLSKKTAFKRKVPLDGGQISYGLGCVSINEKFIYKQGVMSISTEKPKYKINWSNNNDDGYDY
jgi:hypothetical protein